MLSSNLREFHSGRLSGALRIALGVSLALHLVAAVSVKLLWNGNGSGTKPSEPNMEVELSEETAAVSAEAVAPVEAEWAAPLPASEAKQNPPAPVAEVASAAKFSESVSQPPPGSVSQSEVTTTVVVDSNVVATAGSLSRSGEPASSPRVGEGASISNQVAAVAPVNQVLGIVTAKGGPGVLARPVYRKNPEPAYPAAARRRRQEGVTVLAVSVSASGRARRVVVKESSGYQMLDDAAVKAVVEWEFEPARAGTAAVESEIEVPVRFQLKR